MLDSKKPFNPEYEIKKETQPSPTDTVIKHPDNGSYIGINDNGSIVMFTENNAGIKIDPNSKSIQMFGDKTKIRTSKIDFHTDNDGLRWNYTPFNRALANPYKEIVTANRVPLTEISGTERLKDILTSPGTHTTSPTGGPTTPGTSSMIRSAAVGLSGEAAYKGVEELNKMKRIVDAVEDISDSFDFLRWS